MTEITQWAWRRVSSSKILLSDANTLSFKLVYLSLRVCNGDKPLVIPKHKLRKKLGKNGGSQWKTSIHYSIEVVAFSNEEIDVFFTAFGDFLLTWFSFDGHFCTNASNTGKVICEIEHGTQTGEISAPVSSSIHFFLFILLSCVIACDSKSIDWS